MAELVDAHVSGACVARRAGSSPVLGTSESGQLIKLSAFFMSVFFYIFEPKWRGCSNIRKMK